jgi:hypothetical protein
MGRVPHEEPEILKNGIFTGGDIFYCPQNGWIYFILPTSEESWGSEGFVNAQVWTGTSSFATPECPIDYTLEMSFPAGVIDEEKVLLGVYNRELAAHRKLFRADHDPSLNARKLFDDGMSWLLQAGAELLERKSIN